MVFYNLQISVFENIEWFNELDLKQWTKTNTKMTLKQYKTKLITSKPFI